MSEPEGELSPLPERPLEGERRFARSPYLSLAVAAVVVSTAFATVAALAGSGEEQAAPRPDSRGVIESTPFDDPQTGTTTPTTASSAPSTAPSTAASSTTTSSTSASTATGASGTKPTSQGGQPGNTQPAGNPPPAGNTTTPKPTTNPPTTTTQNQAPVASITGGCPDTGYDCTFNGSGSSDPDGDGLTYSWNFGDGGTSSAVSPSHTFAAGSYTVTLTVSDGRGKSHTATKGVTVTAPGTTGA
ncbi:PKD domain-containing protein [Actinophytocola xanthii]|nr:PKD domain-containing protein [Actinophytocola xanthii]